MNDPYKVLGVSPNASDDEIKKAYKELVKKYHPDRYQDSDLADVAAEKMTEVNTAYDQIMTARRSGSAGSFGGSSSYSYGYGGSSGGYSQDGSGSGYSSAFDAARVRQLIQSGSITQAEQILSDVPNSMRDAEWFFLMGSVCYKRGWLNDAYTHFAQAYQRNPSNMEYAQAMNQMNRQRSGYMNGNPMGAGGRSDMDTACNCCSNLICADCCCECMGGDLIPCC
ncbi:DnaJ domain-containing protein [uncultured Ruminococcus sp.]|uniref:DnaJ domain-containing protein n=1 Tax=uncultured Ruminococcus sp. TaxID=165186 RepID=UPI0025E615FD|nr:DnaJ domain-containing protein [uncultured Ruminococcus sp.]